ncbi:glycoside hydrolase family 61 protein [Stemphylium lycopersici]|uniref:Glycoside hydrolase family 61 protein n=1 Tax=Stemphylium lycopersici TaxID=183478 RepID=A0A364MX77_STELY|nr:glycoside hydrolase family 61 protein [Stemphylium lycopersici]RAR05546.1 glycoside hydrolase family 61 protein [Stemphylium lycopersici]RAR06921.1 glycoside hydrolase family 61 protein [Stemphylium lycopersici]
MSMSKIFQTGALVAALISAVAGHTSVEKFECGGKTYEGFRQASKQDPGNKSPAWWTNQGWGYQPIYGDQINHPDIIAHKDASPSPYTVEAPAGKDVTFHWHHEGSCGSGEEGWDCSHHGWTATYLAACNGDCSKVDKTSLEFFKIHQAGLLDYRPGRFSSGQAQEQTGYWGTDAIFYDQGNSQSVTIPSDIPNGNYVLRTEVMSVHNNGPIKNRQFWPQAFNIKVTGGDDNAQLPAGKLGTDLYNDSDELLKWDIYWHKAGETIKAAPGPRIASALFGKVRRHARDFSA